MDALLTYTLRQGDRALVLDGTADTTHVSFVFLDNCDRLARLGQQVACCEPGRTCADDGDINIEFTRSCGVHSCPQQWIGF